MSGDLRSIDNQGKNLNGREEILRDAIVLCAGDTRWGPEFCRGRSGGGRLA
jgi:hypothetical protein